MQLMLIFLYSFMISNSNAFHLAKKTENTKSVTKQRLEISKVEAESINVSKEIIQSDLKNHRECLGGCFWLQGSHCNQVTGFCECSITSIPIGDSCLDKVYFLGGVCTVSEQCQVINSDCYVGRCSCIYGFESSGSIRCQPKNYKPNNGIETDDITIGVISTFIVFAALSIIMSISSCIKKRCSRPDVQADANSFVQTPQEFRSGHIPPEFRRVHSPENEFNTNTRIPVLHSHRTLNIQREAVLRNSEDPPSYADVMRSSKSTSTLITNEEIPEESCPSYVTAMQQGNRTPIN